ncbi:MAG TPA: hypothetical protein VGI17_11485 [Solirubrobacterales bacterium]|jgi:hypothetical protein
MRRLAVLICGVVLGCGVVSAGAGAEGIVPVEGPWHATTSAGLPVSFEVKGGQVVDPRFRFNWGFCGTYESERGPVVPIDPNGHWKHEDGGGPYIEATFVAPDRAEGVVIAPSRLTPGCPKTQATFVAEPGAAPFKVPVSVVLAAVGTRHYAQKPRRMVLKRDGSIRFYDLHWTGWGREVTRATGRAYLRRGRLVRRPRVNVTLTELVEGGEQKVYLLLDYRLHGRVPPGFSRRGERFFE